VTTLTVLDPGAMGASVATSAPVHDPSGAAAVMLTHITEAWLVRRSAPGDPVRLDRE
jgi:hypothetical protein